MKSLLVLLMALFVTSCAMENVEDECDDTYMVRVEHIGFIIPSLGCEPVHESIPYKSITSQEVRPYPYVYLVFAYNLYEQCEIISGSYCDVEKSKLQNIRFYINDNEYTVCSLSIWSQYVSDGVTKHKYHYNCAGDTFLDK